MFILFVYLVSMNLLMIKTEENILNIEIKNGRPETCVIPRQVTLFADTKFFLKVRSDYFVKSSTWERKRHPGHTDPLQQLKRSNFSIHYERRILSPNNTINTLIYTYSYTQKIHADSGGIWNFTFKLLKNYDPWSHDEEQDVQKCWCNTSVEIRPSPKTHNNAPAYTLPTVRKTENGYDGVAKWLIILVSVFGILLLVQSSFMIYGKARKSCKSNRNNDEDPISPKSPKTKRGSKPMRNIADRPPLPLPPDEMVMEEPMPSPIMPPVPKSHHLFPPASAPPMRVENSYDMVPAGPLVPKQSYRNKGLDNSDEEIRSPGFPRRQMEGPLVPKPSYRNKPFDSSDEELRSPGFPRRQMEGPLVPKQSYRNKALDNSDEELRTPGFVRRQLEAKLAQLPPKGVTASKSIKRPKPLPRSQPSPPPEKAPVFHPAHRKELAPPLHPKKLPIFPPTTPCGQPDPRLSDVDWQYETLEPATKYLNNFSDTPYHNI